jgi:methylmalonyl-CoA mutase C-terminal domain/subunit
MVRQRVVVGSVGDDARAREAARRLRDEGREVVYVGAHQSPDQLVRTAVAEDAAAILLDDAGELGIGELAVTPLDVRPDDPRSP